MGEKGFIRFEAAGAKEASRLTPPSAVVPPPALYRTVRTATSSPNEGAKKNISRAQKQYFSHLLPPLNKTFLLSLSLSLITPVPTIILQGRKRKKMGACFLSIISLSI